MREYAYYHYLYVCIPIASVDGHLRQMTPYPVRSEKLSCLKLG